MPVEQVTTGNVLTIVSIVVGLALQYIAIVRSFSERITKIEVEQHIKHAHIDKQLETLTKDVKVIASIKTKEQCHEQPYN